ncbi:hypothetical protein EVG20_g10107 [Dentipellis fragilis]|uniref:Uncharacterized protein n=1 Tax=Dentipellis fragilis TaxID=205917 RepID=A0A4Y9XT38_9AGAM|nr:hypothetical protein EVG20_g10107 [Dentipellis fragilis]
MLVIAVRRRDDGRMVTNLVLVSLKKGLGGQSRNGILARAVYFNFRTTTWQCLLQFLQLLAVYFDTLMMIVVCYNIYMNDGIRSGTTSGKNRVPIETDVGYVAMVRYGAAKSHTPYTTLWDRLFFASPLIAPKPLQGCHVRANWRVPTPAQPHYVNVWLLAAPYLTSLFSLPGPDSETQFARTPSAHIALQSVLRPDTAPLCPMTTFELKLAALPRPASEIIPVPRSLLDQSTESQTAPASPSQTRASEQEWRSCGRAVQ